MNLLCVLSSVMSHHLVAAHSGHTIAVVVTTPLWWAGQVLVCVTCLPPPSIVPIWYNPVPQPRLLFQAIYANRIINIIECLTHIYFPYIFPRVMLEKWFG